MGEDDPLYDPAAYPPQYSQEAFDQFKQMWQNLSIDKGPQPFKLKPPTVCVKPHLDRGPHKLITPQGDYLEAMRWSAAEEQQLLVRVWLERRNTDIMSVGNVHKLCAPTETWTIPMPTWIILVWHSDETVTISANEPFQPFKVEFRSVLGFQKLYEKCQLTDKELSFI